MLILKGKNPTVFTRELIIKTSNFCGKLLVAKCSATFTIKPLTFSVSHLTLPSEHTVGFFFSNSFAAKNTDHRFLQ